MLFQTGFAVDKAQPATDPALLAGRKRKRGPGNEDGKEHQIMEAEVNLEKLMAKLKQAEKGTGANATSSKSREAGRDGAVANWKKQLASTSTISPEKPTEKPLNGKKQGKQPEKREKSTTAAAAPESGKAIGKAGKAKSSEPYVPDEAALAKREARKLKKQRKEESKKPDEAAVNGSEPVEDVTMEVASSEAGPSNPNPAMTDLQKSMQKKLGGARFRWINEQLYTTTGDKALELMKEDPSMFEEYHSGFRSQASSWPSQPINVFIKAFVSAPKGSPKPIIADLGCGDAQLAQTLVPKGYTVFSFDLVEKLPWIVAAQCSKRLPLSGSEDGTGQGALVDAVVCCLSLMGNDWIGMVQESRRVLRKNGKLKIAEVKSRFTDVQAFIDMICSIGFTLISKDDSNTHFILFEFEKVPGKKSPVLDAETINSRSSELLKPCIYKKR